MELLPLDPNRSTLWATRLANRSLHNLRTVSHQRSASLRDCATQCYQLVAVAAALLPRESRDWISSVASYSTNRMLTSLRGGDVRNPNKLADIWAGGMISYIDYACWILDLRVDASLHSLMWRILTDHALAYFAAEPDFHPDLLVGMSYRLLDDIANAGAHASYEAAQFICDELNSVGVDADFKCDLSWQLPDRYPIEQAKPRRSQVSEGQPRELDQSRRLDRLIARHRELESTDADPHRLELLACCIDEVKASVIAVHADNPAPPF